MRGLTTTLLLTAWVTSGSWAFALICIALPWNSDRLSGREFFTTVYPAMADAALNQWPLVLTFAVLTGVLIHRRFFHRAGKRSR